MDVMFSQRDPRWRAEMVGTGTLSIGRVGCLLTAAAGLLASWGVDTDPGRLNAHLVQAQGYVDDNLFVFGALANFGVRCTGYVDCENVAAPVDRLAAAVTAGAGVLVCVDFTPGGQVQMHWVRLLALGARTGQLVDPWQMPGKELVTLDRYLARGWDAARGIFGAAFYSRETGRGLGYDTAQQAALCVRGRRRRVQDGAKD